MAQYNVTFSCGHEETVQLYGKHAERDRKIEYFERSGLCSACYREQKENEKKATSDRDASWAASVQLPPLLGTEKQVAWAESIRRERIGETLEQWNANCDQLADFWGRRESPDATLIFADWLEEQGDAAQANEIRDFHRRNEKESIENFARTAARLAAIRRLRGEQEAKFWIDTKDESLEAFAPGGKLDKAQLEADAAAEAKARIDAKLDAERQAAKEVFGSNVQVKVWLKGTDKRVYADGDGVKVIYYHTGNKYQSPDVLATNDSPSDAAAVKAFCDGLCRRWNSLTFRT